MSRYQPPIINGGTRDAPTWSDLASYYLPQQPFIGQPAPLPPSPFESMRQEYQSRPIVVNQPTMPSFQPSGQGGTAYDEIMARLNRRTPVREAPVEEVVQTEQQSGEGVGDLIEQARAFGLPEDWRNGQPGHGAARAAVMMRPDQVEARRQAALQAASNPNGAIMSGMGYGEGTGTGQFVDLPTGSTGDRNSYGLGEAMSGAGPYNPYNPITGVGMAPGAAAADTTSGWSVATAGRGNQPSEFWSAVGNVARAAGNFAQFAAAMSMTLTPAQAQEVWESYQEAERRRRGRGEANSQPEETREVNTNE